MLSTAQNSPDSALTSHIAQVRARLAAAAAAAGRDVSQITLLAVSKGQPVARLLAAAQLGLRDFGESYVAEALPKIHALAPLKLCWHYIGRVQANKTRDIAQHFDWVHGIDRLHVAQRLSAQRGHYAAALNLCIQVNVLGEASKGGVPPGDVAALAEAVLPLPQLRLRGLMCILPYEADLHTQREGFGRLRELFDSQRRRGVALDTLSMGMSADLEVAVAEGSTLVRVGTALFGPRHAGGPAVE